MLLKPSWTSRPTKSQVEHYQLTPVQFSQSFLTLCNSMDCSMPVFPVHHQLREPTQTHGHWVSPTIQPSHLLSSPSLPPSIFSSIRVFSSEWFFTSGGQSIGVSASASVLPMNIQGWFPLGLTGLISLQSKGLTLKSSPTPQFESINSSLLSLLYGPERGPYSPTLTSTHDYRENHSFDYMDLCQKSNVSAF